MAPTKEDVKSVFAMADKDGKGKLSFDEFKVAFLELTGNKEAAENNECMEELMTDIDKDEDGMLSFDDLYRFMDPEKFRKEDLTNMCKDLDREGNGFLTAAEVKELLLKMTPKYKADVEKNVDFFMRMASADGDKKLKIEEAVWLITAEDKSDYRGKMKTMFRMVDCDGDGYISKKELVNWMKFLKVFDDDDDEEEMDDDDKEFESMFIDMMINAADEDEDGKLNYDEFCILMELS